ncbi:type II toxin-antitoxin system VapC family toxin [Zooshikella ganghwensis]|uniref:Type II toxin-antitoxin system VapC family toxin n=1 Tax=Zooshikella ganghwensis TaxID=202772 RepID=A0A4P9VF99_9GAMM|nr:type II toxin-antitoxin system VapC family toxin [Zooshikella ganghwensis]RDH41765.1 type II toxin-antitoxin system VapC family toxin [Zooshikella ganghwensis]RDH41932.1 type II toxin-antitoxin system VapC family toxin [Zooshikella ganghwensis]
MRILLDTHIALWVFAGDKRINSVSNVILSNETEIYISAASWWELAIKIGLGKLEADLKELRWAARESGFIELPVKGEHTEALLQLPPIHKDPFDRLLVAQAITEPMKLMTADNKLDDYSELIWKI